jgi:glyoxylase-like metal-dependent hydrolase (beta-lactamase superfamily II)
VDAPYGLCETVAPGIARVLAHNPSPYTYTGTQSYILGESEVAVVDPGPDEDDHVDALLAAIAGRPVAAILCTHTHRDHSPGSRPLTQRTGAPIVGCAPLAMEGAGLEAGFDRDYAPDRILVDGEELVVDGRPVIAVHTPGHTSNHLCFAYGDALLTGDHVMGWSTTVVIPPDGDMGDYLASLEKLRHRDDTAYFPAHGPPVTNPGQYVRHLIGHRMQRERQILGLIADRPLTVPEIVTAAYPGLDPRLTLAAGASVLAHLLDLERRGLVDQSGETWTRS